MSWPHLQAFVWLRYRMMVNHWRRAGAINAAVMIILAVIVLATIVPVGIGSFVAGVFLIPRAEPAHLMYAWDALLVLFLLFWTLGLLSELQRNESLSIVKFLHLPVSVNEAFLLNYVSSLMRLSLLFFGPMALGYALALVYVRGVEQWATVPLLAGFGLMVTALTYQFQGWLTLLISNPRRRRAVVVGSTAVVILLCQLPNLLNLYGPWNPRSDADRFAAQRAEQERSLAEFQSLKEDYDEVLRRQQTEGAQFDLGPVLKGLEARRAGIAAHQREQGERRIADEQRSSEEMEAKAAHTVGLVNLALPVGWLPLGVCRAAEGRPWPAVLGLAGMLAVAGVSLGRAYRTTVAMYRGQASNSRQRAPVARPTPTRGPARSRLETRIPGLSEPAAAIAVAGFWSLIRAPEVKLALLSPLILGPIFGSMMLRGPTEIAPAFRPLLGVGAIATVLFGLLQIMGNMFGVDRDGFRVFVLSAVPRRTILHGKNLTFLPLALPISALFLIILQVIRPMRLDHFAAMVPQFASMYLLFALLADVLSIYVPYAINPGTLKPANPKGLTILVQLLVFMALFPLTQALTVLPLAAEFGLNAFGWGSPVPVALLLTLVECAAVVWFYRFALRHLGRGLLLREQQILETVTNRKL